MYELVIVSRELRKQLKKKLPEDMPILLGRDPRGGWRIPWDERISREHFEVRLLDGRLHVEQVKRARNPLLYKGKKLTKFKCAPGDEFRIGRTVVKFVYTDPNVIGVDSTFGEYVIKKTLGSGPATTAYGAIDKQTRQQAVVKVYSSVLGDELKPMFQDELRPWVEMRASGSLAVTYEGGFENNRFYIAREHVPGRSVAQWLQDKGPLPAGSATEMIKLGIRALCRIHDLGLVHGNVTPSNFLMRGEGSVRLTDPMLRCVSDALGDARLAASQYMAPEQIEFAGAANIVSDVYSMGCLWYAMVTGEAPFPPVSGGGLKAARGTPPNPRERCRKLSDAVADVMLRMLAYRPEDRFQQPGEILDELTSSRIAGIIITCEQCGHEYRVNAKYAGKLVKCKECEHKIRVRAEL